MSDRRHPHCRRFPRRRRHRRRRRRRPYPYRRSVCFAIMIIAMIIIR